MADDVTLPGIGAIVAADDVGSKYYQKIKVTWGADGTVNEIDTATGKPLPIQVRSATGLIPVGEPTDAKNSATDTTSVSVISLLKQLSHYLTGRPATGTQSNVADVATDTTILAANSARMGASVTNDSAAILYLLLANATSSATVYTARVKPYGYYEVPVGYTGVRKGIWASDAGGNAEVTEWTA